MGESVVFLDPGGKNQESINMSQFVELIIDLIFLKLECMLLGLLLVYLDFGFSTPLCPVCQLAIFLLESTGRSKSQFKRRGEKQQQHNCLGEVVGCRCIKYSERSKGQLCV